MKTILKIFAAAIICCVIPFAVAGCFSETKDSAETDGQGGDKYVKLTREEWGEAVKVVETSTNHVAESTVYIAYGSDEYELYGKMEEKRDGNVLMSTSWMYYEGEYGPAQRQCYVYKNSTIQWYVDYGTSWERIPVDDYTREMLKAKFENKNFYNGISATAVYSAMVGGQKIEGTSIVEMYDAFTFDEVTGKYSASLTLSMLVNNLPTDMQTEYQICLTVENGKVTKMDGIAVTENGDGKQKSVTTTTYGGVTVTAPPEKPLNYQAVGGRIA